ncbi:reverse transcriptase family protein, partial [Paenibacillus sp. GCM10012307]
SATAVVPRVDLPASVPEAAAAILRRWPALTDESLRMPPQRPGIDHAIEVLPGMAPPNLRARRLLPAEAEELKRQLQEHLQARTVRPSRSPYGSPILFVKKKALEPGKAPELRMCVDYRMLNRVTKKNTYPMPIIQELLDGVGKAKVFTTLDLKRGYHQVRIKEGSEELTAFTTPYGKYEWLVMPFGLCNAPATFQALMHDIFREELGQYVACYLDDLLVYSLDEASHLDHLAAVLGKLAAHGL